MKALGSSISAALGAPVQQPAVLVKVDFLTPRYWTSAGQPLNWSGQTWAPMALDVRDLQVQAYELSGQLVLANDDNLPAYLALVEGVNDRAITLWGYDAAAPTDVVWLASALGGRATVDLEQVSIVLRHPCDGLVSPRNFVSAGTFGPLLPQAAALTINGLPIRLDQQTPY